MIKEILLDGDGVIIKSHPYFSQRLIDDGYNTPLEEVKHFFKNEYPLVATGKADLKEEVSKYVEAWGWKGTVDELLQYWFAGENDIDQEVLDLVTELRAKGVKFYVASDHSSYRSNDLMENVGLKDNFDGSFFSANVGHTKEEPEFFQKVLVELQDEPQNVLFIDDDPKNVEVAKTQGVQAIHYENIEDLKEKMKELGIEV